MLLECGLERQYKFIVSGHKASKRMGTKAKDKEMLLGIYCNISCQ